MSINAEYLVRCLDTLKKSYELIQTVEEGSIEYEMYRNSLVNGFEMTLEQSGKMLKKRIAPYFSSKKNVDALNFKDLFRYVHKFSLLDQEEIQRWFSYRDNRNNTAHDYGQAFAEKSITLVENFIHDVENLPVSFQNEILKNYIVIYNK